jgi:RNA recognition motif-containing protein
MPVRTLNDFFAGFFYGQTNEDLEVDIRIKVQNDRRKSSRRQSRHRKTNIETTKIGGEGDHGQEVIVRHETAPQRKEKSAFSWFEEFTVEWSETFISKN